MSSLSLDINIPLVRLGPRISPSRYESSAGAGALTAGKGLRYRAGARVRLDLARSDGRVDHRTSFSFASARTRLHGHAERPVYLLADAPNHGGRSAMAARQFTATSLSAAS